ncbi:MAG TPA: ATP-dependent RecD-like DNA helicase [Oligoflexia bacterium]|nr:ATP-dependent RecD-like DNA helicase [Oligoflexia bacterium]HMP49836.1 ATP-dependent RecD-like DNA helicase [Oligoflexia bacterium]
MEESSKQETLIPLSLETIHTEDHENEDTLNHSESNNTELNKDKFLKGIVQKITFRSHDTGFGVLRISPESNDPYSASTTMVGIIPSTLCEGASFIARGNWQSHPKFGSQFKAISITETQPTSTEAIIKYLSSGVIKGIGPVLAERIVGHFKEDTLKIFEEEPHRLKEVNGIGESRIEEISSIWSEKKEEREVLLFFQNHGIVPYLARRIYAAYRNRAIETVSKNPYLLCEQVWGIGFLTADKIARALGMSETDLARIKAGIHYTLTDAQSEGHTYLPHEILVEKSKSILSISDLSLIERAILQATLEGFITQQEDKYFSPLLFTLERKAAGSILTRINSPGPKPVPEYLVHQITEWRSSQNNADNAPIVLSDEQKLAVKLAAEKSILVITGGPGCGKTTIINSIGKLFKMAGLSIRLTAPTGRAAQRLQEVCNIEASTIHRMLRYDPIQKSFIHNESDPLPYDVIIVDESSMIDIPLAASLLAAVKSDTRLIFVGDADQLPSVGPGLFFLDLLEIKSIPQVRLTRLFRRSEESSINDIAHQVNHGVAPVIPEPDGKGRKDAYFLPAENQENAAQLIERLVSEQIPKQFNIKPEDITVLSPMNQGDLGIISLNRRLQKRLIKHRDGTPSVKVGEIEFRVGDRVCQRVNNYNIHEAGVYNGEQGYVYGIDTEKRAIYVKMWDGRDVTYTTEHIHQLDLAYAITIHRSQGSEVPVVVLVLHDSHGIMLERQLVYTAVTRAKKLLIVVGTRSAIQKACKRSKSRKRYTAFRELIENLDNHQRIDTE